ncbi:MAG TPA: hypothetical protein VMF66_18530 [Candidatus Acidoferrum sp.]|nr:hypothetical protein [Candidatus Acidoferrum sp.]
MTSQQILGLWIIGGFLFVCCGEGVAIVVLAYKLGVCKGKVAKYELAEKQTPATQYQS